MSIRNFDALFQPRVIALIGASNTADSVGNVIARNLFSGGFRGPILAVNPNEAAIGSVLSYHSVEDLPLTPDLAVIATPPATVPGLIEALGRRGCRAAVVVTGGMGAMAADGTRSLRQAALDAARPHLLRVIGPNCVGFLSTPAGINASFAPTPPLPGDLAFVSQSGAVVTTALDWAAQAGIGLSHVLSLGDMADVDFGDALDYLASDGRTRAILMYLEAVTNPRKFVSAARIAARSKPVLVLKGGRGAAGARAALSHTGALMGSDAVTQAMFRRAGLLSVDRLEELFEAAASLATRFRAADQGLVIVTNGGGVGVLAADEAERRGLSVAQLAPDLVARLDAVLPAGWSRANPIDIIGDAGPDRYAPVIDLVAKALPAAPLLLMHCPTGVVRAEEAARAAARAAPPGRALACWLDGGMAARRALQEAGVPAYATPDAAIRALSHHVQRRRDLEALQRTPPALPDETRDLGPARALIAAALADGRTVLSGPETLGILAAFAIPVLRGGEAGPDPDDAARVATALGASRLALKIRSRDISHKSDVGGVRLDLEPGEVADAARTMLATVRAARPTARLEGFSLQEMVDWGGGAVELIAGLSEDPTLGPVVLVGAGGIATEVIGDTAVTLAPLDLNLAHEALAATRVSRLLRGYRNVPPADTDGVARTLVALARLAADLPEIVELDINPLRVAADGVQAIDARAVIRHAPADPARRFPILPYPRHLERHTILEDGTALGVRPIKPEDEPLLIDLLRRSTEQDRRYRFHGSIKEFTHEMAARLCQIDYDREMALVAVLPEGDFAGVGRLYFEPDFERAEYALFVRSDLQGRGMGRFLLRAVLDHAASRGARRVWGDVVRENRGMLHVAEALGAQLAPPEDGIVTTSFTLAA